MSTTREIVERLRDMHANFVEFSQTSNNDMHRRLYFNRAEVSRLAASRLDELERDNERLREALQIVRSELEMHINGKPTRVAVEVAIAFEIAREALAGSGEK